jgi:Flp pilus assembly protein TadG
MLNRISSYLTQFCGQERGSFAMVAAIALPTLALGTGIAVDYSRMQNARTVVQSAADTAALATVKEAALIGTSAARMADTAKTFAISALGQQGTAARINATASSADGTVTVDITLPVASTFGRLTGASETDVAATATARLVGSSKLCLLALDTSKDKTLDLAHSARVRAPDCSVFVNSTRPKALSSKDSGKLIARSICTAGGFDGTSMNFDPLPKRDCPPIPDPLAARPPPPAGPCDYTDKIVETAGLVVLKPGVYCGGLKITKQAVARLEPGIYVIRGSTLVVDSTASIEGDGVGFYLEDDKAQFEFTKDAAVSLKAPTTGPMAGLLFFEDRNAAPKTKHKILSNNANVLLGTIYLPRGQLYIGADRPIADRSAFTIIVANQIEMQSGPELFLNADYNATTVPVPKGLGPVPGRPQLVR